MLLRNPVRLAGVLLWCCQAYTAEMTNFAQLSPDQKRADFKYLTQLVREQSPFVVLNRTQKGLDDVNALAPIYIQRAGETPDDREFLRLLQEYINRIRHTGHQMMMGAGLAKGYSGEAKVYDLPAAAFTKSVF